MADAIACPGCGKAVPLEAPHRPATAPFCSQRCRLLDLGAWAEGRYAVSRPIHYGDEDLIEEDRS